MQKITLKKFRKEAQKSDEECTAKIDHALDPNMDMTMDVYEVNDLKELWETDLEVSLSAFTPSFDLEVGRGKPFCIPIFRPLTMSCFRTNNLRDVDSADASSRFHMARNQIEFF